MSKTLSDVPLIMCDAKQKLNQLSDLTKIKGRFNGLSAEERRLDRRQRLMEAGLELYGTKGFLNVKVKDICIEAQLTERYFYESFEHSGILFFEVYTQQINKLYIDVSQAIVGSGNDLNHTMILGLTAFLKTIRDDARMTRILYMDSLQVKEITGFAMGEAHQVFELLMLSYFKTALNIKEFSTTAKYIATGLSGYCSSVVLRWVNSNFEASFDEVLSSMLYMFRSFLTAIEADQGLILEHK